LAHLANLTGDQEQLVEAVRRFHRQQLALVDWDRRLLTDYSQDGQDDLALTKVQDIRKRVALARDAWRYVLDYYPNNALANNYYGELQYDHLGDPAGGVQSWLLATRLDDKLGLPHNNLALHYVHAGQIDTGLRHLGKALDLDPKNPDFLYNGAQFYLNYFPRLEKQFEFKKVKLYKEAMRMSRDAAKYAPGDFQIVQDYAVNFFAAQNFGVEPDWNEAAAAWQKAQALAPGEEEKFYTVLNRALAIRPESDVAQRLLGELQSPTAPAAESASE
jgi:tetratricopeptide (TPR) repeat protein